jgi:hypothetical protein
VKIILFSYSNEDTKDEEKKGLDRKGKTKCGAKSNIKCLSLFSSSMERGLSGNGIRMEYMINYSLYKYLRYTVPSQSTI